MFPEEGHQSAAQQQVAINGESYYHMLQAIHKIFPEKQKLWPEIIRLILHYIRLEDPHAFGPAEEKMQDILTRLAGLKP